MFRRVVVAGRSMEPTLREGQRLLVARWFRPRRGDVVVVQHPHLDLRVVKRIAAAPGDWWMGRILGKAEFAVRGDNPDATTDSVRWGPVPRSALRGRVLWSYAPWRSIDVRHSPLSTRSAHGSQM